ncbi:MAG: deoxynucleotide monophosphate kinase [Gammaproteobacteria bacterium]|nr:deoxynucleotide monophosphate kinase [Gammaproteobacteria bacterium]
MNKPFPICGWTIKGKPALIGFAGKARSGKDTAGAYLVENYQFLRYSFAQPLKDATKIMFHLTDKQIENKEKAAEPWGRSPRELYQLLGTDIARTIDVNVWVKGADIFKQDNPGRSIVITDVRFSNEAFWIRSQGGIVVFLESKTRGIFEGGGHLSENGLTGEDVDLIIENDGTIEALHVKLEELRKKEVTI